MTTPFHLERDGVALAGIEFGGDGPGVLLLHGLAGARWQLVEIEGSGHDVHLDRPQEWRAAVTKWLDSVR